MASYAVLGYPTAKVGIRPKTWAGDRSTSIKHKYLKCYSLMPENIAAVKSPDIPARQVDQMHHVYTS